MSTKVNAVELAATLAALDHWRDRAERAEAESSKMYEVIERLAWMRGMCDAARRELCEALGALRGVGWSGRHIAVERGWGYLYSEPETEPDCPFELLGPCDAGGRGHHVHTVAGVIYDSAEPVAVVADEEEAPERVPVAPGWYLWGGKPAHVWSTGELQVTTHEDGTHPLDEIADEWGGPCDQPDEEDDE